MDAAAAKLMEVAAPLAQKMYAEQAEASAAPGADGGEAEAKPSDEGVVEAEFEEVKDDKK